MSNPVCHQDPAKANDSAARAELGKYYSWDGDLYRYVQFKDAVTYADGQVVTWDNQDGFAVTNDISSMEATSVSAAGVCRNVMTAEYYGYILVRGYHGTVSKKPGVDTWTADDLAIPSSDTDGAVDLFAPNVTTTAATTAELLAMVKTVIGVLGTVAGASDDTADTVPIDVNVRG